VRALITGAAGFVGQWTCRALLREGWEVFGVSLEGEPTRGILTETERRAVHWTARDLTTPTTEASDVDATLGPVGPRVVYAEAPIRPLPSDPADARDGGEWLGAAVLAYRPDVVIHLAGVAYLPQAEAEASRAVDVNVNVAMSVLQAAWLAKQTGAADPTVLIVGSGEQYGAHPAEAMPLVETAGCHPSTFYGKTKQAQESLALRSATTLGVRAIATRSFNHSGPGQAPTFLLPSLVARALEARRTGQSVRIGNTDVIRDFLHVEDVVSAYISLVSRGHPGEVYNVCSGVGVRVGDLAQDVLSAAGVRAPLDVDPALQRAVDVPVLVGSNAKLRAATGWAPVKSRSAIIQDLLDAAS
jgi:GDP-4-dehydro-6-deoxy-D-mannose reductase